MLLNRNYLTLKKYKKKSSFNLITNFKIILIFSFFCLIVFIKFFSGLKVLLCSIGKKENKYIKEFIQYYRQLKVNKIILYDNNDINGENFQDVLQNDILKNFVQIINFRGVKLPQKKAVP